ncbi:unnamed protein product [Trifolium pratense]|uniref:Uncharacterized protein n=1 Tax=Trifolium pratense TaxID=57577 RepID=A0ACB0KAC6_TRIPR|nr:unnamed protein product [Trifolium pratense]
MTLSIAAHSLHIWKVIVRLRSDSPKLNLIFLNYETKVYIFLLSDLDRTTPDVSSLID